MQSSNVLKKHMEVCIKMMCSLPSLSKQVNIDFRTREKTKQSLADPSPTSLNEVQGKIYSLMEKDSYPRVLRSKMYQDMVNRAHAQGQRRSVWPNPKSTVDIKQDLYTVDH